MKSLMEPNIISELVEYNEKRSIYVLALGGTIAALSYLKSDEFYEHPTLDINELISSLPLDKEKITVISEQILQKISHDITDQDLIVIAKKINALVNRDDVDGVVITQGTNCIEETAYFINLVIKTKKTIVFTGAFRPSNALGFDGGRNLYNAILLASNQKIAKIGVVLTFNDCIVSAREASKSNPSILGDLSTNGAGIVGYIQGKEPIIQRIDQHKHTFLSEFSIGDIIKLPKIYIIYGHLGVDCAFVEAAIANNAKGIISAGMGKGYQPYDLTQGLIEASKRGIFIVRCSRSGQGIVNRDPKLDDQHGFIAGGSLSPQKARILLSIALANSKKNKIEIQQIFDEY